MGGGYMVWLYFVILIVIGLLLFVNGLKDKSQLFLFFGIALIIPILYFIGIQKWFVLLPLVPAISMLISHLVIKKLNTA